VIDDYAELCLAGLAKLKADLSVRQAGHRKKGAGGGEGQASRGDQGKPKRAKPRLEQSEKEADKLKCQLYQFIQNLHAAGKKPADILTELKGNPDRMAQVKGAGLNAKMNLIRAALALPGQRERDAKRKKQDSPPA